MIQRDDLLAYLIVLNYEPVLNKLSPGERAIGHCNIMGCLIRVEEQLDTHFMGTYSLTAASLLCKIRLREKLNSKNPSTDPRLQESTADTANSLYAELRERFL